jgi:hypothetical protein
VLSCIPLAEHCEYNTSLFLFLVALTLERRTSVKHFISLQFLNPKTFGRTPWTRDQPVARPLPKQTRNKQTNTHSLSEVRTHDPSVRVDEDSSCLRTRGPVIGCEHKHRHRIPSNNLHHLLPCSCRTQKSTRFFRIRIIHVMNRVQTFTKSHSIPYRQMY